MERIAVIDLGTNTFNILIVDVAADKTYQQVFQNKISVKLAEGGITKGFIAPVPFERGIEAMNTHKTVADKYKVQRIHAFATSAIRGASNGNDFVKRVKTETGIDIKVIPGDREAELIYYGVRQAVSMDEKNSLVIDIGGGSTEFIIGNKNGIVWKQSFLLGAARLFEIFHPSDPIREEEVEAIGNYLEKELQPLFAAVEKYGVSELIGSSGSFDSLAEMIAWKYYTPEILLDKTEYTFDLADCEALYNIIIASNTAERLKMKGLVAMRVDMIVVSSIIVNFVIRSFHIQKMRLSTYSLKEGVLHELLR
jgi:exopolyphosphatase/guanosine-5'-triphosphate,3'-diphosphate pyrophosphatase